jgi:hypothetical protein
MTCQKWWKIGKADKLFTEGIDIRNVRWPFSDWLRKHKRIQSQGHARMNLGKS